MAFQLDFEDDLRMEGTDSADPPPPKRQRVDVDAGSESSYKRGRQPCPICGEIKDRMPPKSVYCYEHKRTVENALASAKQQDAQQEDGQGKRYQYLSWEMKNNKPGFRKVIAAYISATGGERTGKYQRNWGFFDHAKYFESEYRATEVIEGTKKIRMTNDRFCKWAKEEYSWSWDKAQAEWGKMLSDPAVIKDVKFGETRCAVEVEDYILDHKIAGHRKEAQLGQRDKKNPKITDLDRMRENASGGHTPTQDLYVALGLPGSAAPQGAGRSNAFVKPVVGAPRLAGTKMPMEDWVVVPADWEEPADDIGVQSAQDEAASLPDDALSVVNAPVAVTSQASSCSAGGSPVKALDTLAVERSIEQLTAKSGKCSHKYDDAVQLYEEVMQDVASGEGLERRMADVQFRHSLASAAFQGTQIDWTGKLDKAKAEGKAFPIEDIGSVRTLPEIRAMVEKLPSCSSTEDAKQQVQTISGLLDLLWKLAEALRKASAELKRAKGSRVKVCEAGQNKKRAVAKANAKTLAKRAESTDHAIFRTDFEKFGDVGAEYSDTAAYLEARTGGSVPRLAPYLIRQAPEIQAAIDGSESLKSCLEVFKLQFPSSKKGKAEGRAQAPPPMSCGEEAALAAMGALLPPGASRATKDVGQKDSKEHRYLLQLSMWGSTAKRGDIPSPQMSYVGMEPLCVGTARFQINGRRALTVLSFRDAQDFVVNVFCGGCVEAKEVTVEMLRGLVRSFDAGIIQEMRDHGVRFWHFKDVPAGSLACVPMASIVIERNLGAEHIVGLRMGYLAYAGSRSFAAVATCMPTKDLAMHQWLQEQVPGPTAEDQRASLAEAEWSAKQQSQAAARKAQEQKGMQEGDFAVVLGDATFASAAHKVLMEIFVGKILSHDPAERTLLHFVKKDARMETREHDFVHAVSRLVADGTTWETLYDFADAVKPEYAMLFVEWLSLASAVGFPLSALANGQLALRKKTDLEALAASPPVLPPVPNSGDSGAASGGELNAAASADVAEANANALPPPEE